jgi:hypothetical protein
MDFLASGFQGFWVSGFLGFWVSGFLGFGSSAAVQSFFLLRKATEIMI